MNDVIVIILVFWIAFTPLVIPLMWAEKGLKLRVAVAIGLFWPIAFVVWIILGVIDMFKGNLYD